MEHPLYNHFTVNDSRIVGENPDAIRLFGWYNDARFLDETFGGLVSYADKLKDSLYWWLGKKKPFFINNEYKLELLFIDKINNSAKIKITNIKEGGSSEEVVVPVVEATPND